MNDFIKNAIQESLENKGIKDGEIINMNKLGACNKALFILFKIGG